MDDYLFSGCIFEFHVKILFLILSSLFSLIIGILMQFALVTSKNEFSIVSDFGTNFLHVPNSLSLHFSVLLVFAPSWQGGDQFLSFNGIFLMRVLHFLATFGVRVAFGSMISNLLSRGFFFLMRIVRIVQLMSKTTQNIFH
jgi:hypothetical protein